MNPSRTLLPLVLVLMAVLVPSVSRSDSALAAAGHGARAALDFRIVIPPVMRVVENSYPQQLAASEGAARAEQRLIVMSNLKHGFCASLRLTNAQVQGWRLQAAPDPAVSLQAVADGYRLCANRPGRYTLVLQHAFDTLPGSEQTALQWPVQTNITAL